MNEKQVAARRWGGQAPRCRWWPRRRHRQPCVHVVQTLCGRGWRCAHGQRACGDATMMTGVQVGEESLDDPRVADPAPVTLASFEQPFVFVPARGEHHARTHTHARARVRAHHAHQGVQHKRTSSCPHAPRAHMGRGGRTRAHLHAPRAHMGRAGRAHACSSTRAEGPHGAGRAHACSSAQGPHGAGRACACSSTRAEGPHGGEGQRNVEGKPRRACGRAHGACTCHAEKGQSCTCLQCAAVQQ